MTDEPVIEVVFETSSPISVGFSTDEDLYPEFQDLPPVVVEFEEPSLPPIVVSFAETGLRGPIGPPGTTDIVRISRRANTILGGHRLVVPNVDGGVSYADHNNFRHVNRPVWLTDSAWQLGETAELVAYGTIDEISWNWIPGKPVFLAEDGKLTQIFPTEQNSLFFRQVGVAETKTRLFYAPAESLLWVARPDAGADDIYSDIYGEPSPEFVANDTYSDVYTFPADGPVSDDTYSDTYRGDPAPNPEYDTYTNIYVGEKASTYSDIYSDSY